MDFETNLGDDADDDEVAFKRTTFDEGNALEVDLVVRWKDVFGRIHKSPVVIDAIIDAHPLSPNKKRSRTGKFEIRIDDSRLGVGDDDEGNQ